MPNHPLMKNFFLMSNFNLPWHNLSQAAFHFLTSLVAPTIFTLYHKPPVNRITLQLWKTALCTATQDINYQKHHWHLPPTFNYPTMQDWASYFCFEVKSFAPKYIKSAQHENITEQPESNTGLQAVDTKYKTQGNFGTWCLLQFVLIKTRGEGKNEARTLPESLMTNSDRTSSNSIIFPAT